MQVGKYQLRYKVLLKLKAYIAKKNKEKKNTIIITKTMNTIFNVKGKASITTKS